MSKVGRTIRARFADARAAMEDSRQPADPPPLEPRNGIPPGKWPGFPYDNLPPECPVEVHGFSGQTIYVTDASGQLIELDKLDATSLTKLFGSRQNYCEWAFPRFGKPIQLEGHDQPFKPVTGLEYQKMGRCFVAEAHRRGQFDPARQHRGRGGWIDDQNRFLWHAGEWVWTADKGKLFRARPGRIGEHLYTVAPPLIDPWPEPVPDEDSPGQILLEILNSWRWHRPFLDPALVLGWCVVALMGGALDARPIIFTTGGPGVGKTTLHNFVQALLSSTVMVTADTTSAGITQEKERDSTAVIVDEFESDASNRLRRKAVIDLARIAYSGGRIYRGGQDHTGVSFEARFSFLFSAIIAPPMTTADRSRMAVLNLDRLDSGEARTPPARVLQADWGRQLLRRILDGWQEFSTRTLPDWKETLRMQGFDERAADTWGTLLAAAELALGPKAMEDSGLPLSDQRELGEMIAAATRDDRKSQRPPWQQCLERLLAAPCNAIKGGERPTIGSTLELLEATEAPIDFNTARDRLNLSGLAMVDRYDRRRPGKDGTVKLQDLHGYGLAIPPDGQALEEIFTDTIFEAGGWMQALRQAPPHVVLRGSSNDYAFTINRSTKKCLVIDLAAYDAWQAEESAR